NLRGRPSKARMPAIPTARDLPSRRFLSIDKLAPSSRIPDRDALRLPVAEKFGADRHLRLRLSLQFHRPFPVRLKRLLHFSHRRALHWRLCESAHPQPTQLSRESPAASPLWRPSTRHRLQTRPAAVNRCQCPETTARRTIRRSRGLRRLPAAARFRTTLRRDLQQALHRIAANGRRLFDPDL